ncbi:Coiled-coil domain-containing protein 84, partial [Tupaia chinensis]
VDLRLQSRAFWYSLHGQVPGLLDWDMGNECFLTFITEHLPLAEQKLARYKLRIVHPPRFPLERKPNPDGDGPDFEPNLWMWVNPNIVYPLGKLEVAAYSKKEELTSTLSSPRPPPKDEDASCSESTELTEEEEAEDRDDSSSVALPSPHKRAPLQRRRLLQANSQEGRLWPRPPLNYFHLIALALRNSPPRGLNVQQIYSFTRQHFPFFRTAPEGWKNTIRHNLCFRDSFEKVPASVQGGTSTRPRSCLWKLTEEGRRRFAEEARALASSQLETIQRCMSQPGDHLQIQKRGSLSRLVYQNRYGNVEAARKAIRAAQVERYVPEHERRCWCLCCGCEVRKHLSHGNLTVLHGGLLEHLASPEHKKATNKFWWENKAEVQMKEKFLISPQDYARFKKSMVKGLDSYEEKEDEVIKEMAAQIREVEQSRQEVVRSVLEVVPDPEEGSSAPGRWNGTNSPVASKSQQLSALDLPPAPDLDWTETGQPLTFIGHQDMPGVGNIHSGATPPWMVQEEEHSSDNQQIGPSYEEFLKEKEKQKLKKLPPDRVGANFDHSSSTSAGWLPSFGRVWNNGRRWQSRHQFKCEATARNKQSHKGKN